MDKIFYFELCAYIILAAAYFKSKRVHNFTEKIHAELVKVNSLQFTIFAFAFVIFSAPFIICDGHNWSGDFSQYLAQTRALLTGEISQWLEKQSFIIKNSTPGFAPLMYPFGTSIILLPLYKIFGLNFIAFKILEAVFFAGAVAIFFLFVKLKFNPRTAAVSAALILFNANYLCFIDNILSEMPCLFFTMLTIFLIYKRELTARKIFYGALIGATIFFSVQIRTLSVALLIALALDDIFKKTKIAERAAPYVVYAVLSVIGAIFLPHAEIFQAGYLVTFSFKPEDIFSQIWAYIKIFGEFLLPVANNFVAAILGIVWLAVAAFGAIKSFGEDRWLIFYVVVTLGILFTFNTSGGARYVFGIFPAVIYFSVTGLKFLQAERICKGLAFVILSASLIFEVIFAGIFYDSNEAFSAEARQAYDFISKNIGEDEVIYFFKPRVLYFATGVYSYGATGNVGAEDLSLADYLLVTPDDWYSDLKSLAQSEYELIFENEKFKLYRIKR